MDEELERVIARLERRFDAALAHEEEEAARDLAMSLRQGRSLSDLVRGGQALRVLETGGVTATVTVVGADYCGTGRPLTCLRRLGSMALIEQAEGAPPESRRDSLQEVARRWARCGYTVELGLEEGRLRGRLMQVGPDNLMMEATAGRVIVPLWLVRSIRLVHED